ncbi:hypothetical protein I4U23_004447 [Adineta vaga]|nr:hypothetical protein I4U23_004447 [Adineta vaga]
MESYASLNDIIDELKQQRDENPHVYIPVPIEPERTILLMGSTRAGKSTIVRTLANSLYQPERPTLYSATRTPEPQKINGLTIIDMPGFNDLRVKNPPLSNNLILRMLQEQMEKYHPIDLFAFVFNYQSGITNDDINSMINVKSEFPDLAGRTILLVTHAEELDDKAKNRLIDEFYSHPKISKNHLEDFFQKEIFFLGCLRYESINRPDIVALTNEHENVLSMRKTFIQKCFRNLPPRKLLKQKQSIYKYLSILAVIMAVVLVLIAYSFSDSGDKQIDTEDPMDHSIHEFVFNTDEDASLEEKQISSNDDVNEDPTDTEKKSSLIKEESQAINYKHMNTASSCTTNESRDDIRRRGNQDKTMTVDEMSKDLYKEMGNMNEYQFQTAIQRTLVLLGRTRVGKTTLMKVIQNPLYRPDMPSIFSETGRVNIHQFVTNHKNRHYSFTIIDSPGLYECMRHDGRPLTNETVKHLLDNCITQDVTHIHAFAFVFSIQGSINDEDIQSMIFIKKHYPTLKKFFMLILTHCEEKTDEEKKRLTDEFFSHPRVIKHNLHEFFNLGYFYTGSLRPELGSNPNLEAAISQQRKVLEMRSVLLDFLIQREETFNIHQSNITSSNTLERFKQVLLWLCAFLIGMFFLLIFFDIKV